jgi:hypothetical protein
LVRSKAVYDCSGPPRDSIRYAQRRLQKFGISQNRRRWLVATRQESLRRIAEKKAQAIEVSPIPS